MLAECNTFCVIRTIFSFYSFLYSTSLNLWPLEDAWIEPRTVQLQHDSIFIVHNASLMQGQMLQPDTHTLYLSGFDSLVFQPVCHRYNHIISLAAIQLQLSFPGLFQSQSDVLRVIVVQLCAFINHNLSFCQRLVGINSFRKESITRLCGVAQWFERILLQGYSPVGCLGSSSQGYSDEDNREALCI